MRLVGVGAAALLVVCAACGQDSGGRDATSSDPATTATPTPSTTATSGPTEPTTPVLMPDLIGLPEAEAMERLGALEGEAKLRLSFSWVSEPVVDCSSPPHTVIRQTPDPGTPLGRRTEIEVRPARLDLDRFRGPCEPTDGELGPLLGADAALAREFYRFSADPAVGDPFVRDEVWIGIEDGLVAKHLTDQQLADLSAWQLDSGYAERSGPFSALDIVASSGGNYEVHPGVLPTCSFGNAKPPPELRHLRAVTLTGPRDTVTACMDWWSVSLFLDGGLIRGVALRLGSP